MSLYVDTSCLLKLVLDEPESERLRAMVQSEPRVVISTLAELEAEQHLWAEWLGGRLTKRQHSSLRGFLEDFRGTAPFFHLPAPHDLPLIARRQIQRSSSYCRTLDRLHLAAMEALGIQRLFTNDNQQAAAARELGYGVVSPRWP